MILRAMRWQDIPAVLAVEQELFPGDAWTVGSWWHELAGRPRRDYVVATDGSVVGYAGVDHGGVVADIMTVAVHPRAQGRGLGGRLVHHLVQRAATEGAASVMLEVRADNAAARALYRRNGFDVISTRSRYYQPDDVDALVMRRAIGQVDR